MVYQCSECEGDRQVRGGDYRLQVLVLAKSLADPGRGGGRNPVGPISFIFMQFRAGFCSKLRGWLGNPGSSAEYYIILV